MFEKESDLSTNLKFRSTANSSKLKPDYQRLYEFCDRNEYVFQEPESINRKIPWKAILLAVFLLLVGTIVIITSCLIYTGFIVNIRPTDGLLILTFLGFLMFIPGFYHCRIAYYAYNKYPGFEFDEIPDFD